MRDLLIIAIVLAGSIAALRRPWIGVLLWTWLSIMNPHRYSWGIAYDAPLAAMAAASTLIGLILTKEKWSPFIGAPVVWFSLFCAWVTISWLVGLDPSGDYYQWNKIFKINLMIFVALALIRSKTHIIGLSIVVVTSLALLGIKGGLFTVLNGGNYRVWGPPGSFIEDNNEFALALVMTIPLLRFLQLQAKPAWLRLSILATMVLCAASALGSHSRGGFLALAAMAVYFWWRGKNKFVVGVLLLAVSAALVAFMPDSWSTRMDTMQSYEEDASAMGRISAWWTAWNLAWHYPAGVGFNPARPDLFALYSPYPTSVHAAHSIYFQILGNHGFIGLFFFLGMWISTWRNTAWLLKEAPKYVQAKWCVDLATMCQVALLAYAVGGAFLSLAYFDLPYNIMLMMLVTRLWVQQQAWRNEPDTAPKWLVRLGFADVVPKGAIA